MERALDATVAIVDDEGDLFCAGVGHDGMVLTAAHCVDDKDAAPLVSFRQYNDRPGHFWKSFTYQVSHLDTRQDLAVLSPTDARFSPEELDLAPNPPWYGQSIIVIGHPIGHEYSITSGIISHPRRVWSGEDYDGMVWFQFDAGSTGGNSGGPILNEYGEILGLTSFGYRGLSHMNGAVHWESITNALDSEDR